MVLFQKSSMSSQKRKAFRQPFYCPSGSEFQILLRFPLVRIPHKWTAKTPVDSKDMQAGNPEVEAQRKKQKKLAFCLAMSLLPSHSASFVFMVPARFAVSASCHRWEDSISCVLAKPGTPGTFQALAWGMFTAANCWLNQSSDLDHKASNKIPCW